MAASHPELAEEWHPTKNGELTPMHVTAGSHKKIWWRCNSGHVWQASVSDRGQGRGCPYCSNKRADISNCLSNTHPEIAKEWHPSKNEGLTPYEVVAGSNKKVWWQCLEGPDHEWQATVVNRTKGRGCPRCNKGWTLEAIRLFVLSLSEHLHTFTPAELYLLFQHNQLGQTQGRSKAFVKALTTGRFPKQEIERFVNSQ